MTERNPYHVKAGSPEGGQFTTGPFGRRIGGSVESLDNERIAQRNEANRRRRYALDRKAADIAGTAARKAAGLSSRESVLEKFNVAEIINIGYEQMKAGGSVDAEDALRIYSERQGITFSAFEVKILESEVNKLFKNEFKRR